MKLFDRWRLEKDPRSKTEVFVKDCDNLNGRFKKLVHNIYGVAAKQIDFSVGSEDAPEEMASMLIEAMAVMDASFNLVDQANEAILEQNEKMLWIESQLKTLEENQSEIKRLLRQVLDEQHKNK